MVLVKGLDRIDGSVLAGMPDALWSRHTAELRQRFENQEPPPLGFGDFCARFDTGELSTLAMREHTGSDIAGDCAGVGVDGAGGSGAGRGGLCVIGPAWTRGEIEKPEGVRNMGSYDALFYTEEQQRRLGVDESGAKVARDRSKFFAPEAAPAASGRFPEHWGRPPLKQTRDLRPLPGGYGMGSGTLAKWVAEKMAVDAAGGAGSGAGASAARSWPDLVGSSGEAAAAAIRAERPSLSVSLVGVDDMMTMDFREDRVRIRVKEDGTVDSVPQVG